MQAVMNDFGGVWLRNGEGAIMLPTDRLHCELERSLTTEAAPVSGASDSVSPSAAISDLRTDTVIHVTAHADQANASMDFIDLSDPSTTSRLSAVVDVPSPASLPAVATAVEVGHIYAEKREYEIPVHFYAVPESQKLETATQILLTGGGAKDDVRNNARVTLVGRNSTELVATMLRIDAAGVNCFWSDDPYIRDGHSFHPSVVMSVNVTTAPVCSNIKYSQHVLFLSSTDFRDVMDVMMLQHTDVNLVTVLFDESDDDQRFLGKRDNVAACVLAHSRGLMDKITRQCGGPQVDGSNELIDFSASSSTPVLRAVEDEPSPTPLLPAVVSPMEASYNEVREDHYPVHLYAAPETDHTASDFVSTRAALPDLLTDSVIHITDCVDQDDTSVDLIDLSDASPQRALPSALVLPVKVGYIYAKKREFEIPVHFYTALESEKLEMVIQFLLNGPYAEQGDTNNNRTTKVTLVARSSSELIAAMLRIDAAGMDCFSCDDHSIRDGHSSHPSQLMTVNVTKAPVSNKIQHTQHVVFLSPVDDPEDLREAMEVMMLERTDVNLVSVLFDRTDDHQLLQVFHMLNVLALAYRQSSLLQFLC